MTSSESARRRKISPVGYVQPLVPHARVIFGPQAALLEMFESKACVVFSLLQAFCVQQQASERKVWLSQSRFETHNPAESFFRIVDLSIPACIHRLKELLAEGF